MDEAMILRLNAATGITAITGNRISWFERPRSGGDSPAIVLTHVSAGVDYTMTGEDGLPFAWVQFDLWATDAAALPALEAAVIAEMHGTGTWGGVRFHNGFVEGRQQFEPDDLADGARAYRNALDFQFHHELV